MFDVTPVYRTSLIATATRDAARMEAAYRASGRSSGYGDLDTAGGKTFPAACMARDDADGFAFAALEAWRKIAMHRAVCRDALRDKRTFSLGGYGREDFPAVWAEYRRCMAVWGRFAERYKAALWGAGRLSLPRVEAPVDPMTLPNFRAVVLGDAA